MKLLISGLITALVTATLLTISAMAPQEARADGGQPGTAASDGVVRLIEYMDHTWLLPNGLQYQDMVDNQPTDLAILMGLALRSQTPHLERNPSLEQAFGILGTECANYLHWLAGATRAATDPWGNPLRYETLEQVFLTSVRTNSYDQYSRDAYGVDPMPLVYDDLLTPIAQAADPGSGGQQPAEPSAKFQPKDDPKGIILLGVEAEPVEIDVNPQAPAPSEGQ